MKWRILFRFWFCSENLSSATWKEEAWPCFNKGEMEHGAFVEVVICQNWLSFAWRIPLLAFCTSLLSPEEWHLPAGSFCVGYCACDMQRKQELKLYFWVLLVPLWLPSSLNAVLCHMVNHKSTWTIPWLDKTELVQGNQTVMSPERCVSSTSLENSHFLRKLFASLYPLGYQELLKTVSGHLKLPALFTILSSGLLHHLSSFWLEQWCIYTAKKPYLIGGGRMQRTSGQWERE